jgi:hypothetical protein
MQNPFYDHKPDSLEKRMRFGCGFLFGLVLGFFGTLRVMYKMMYWYNSAGLVISIAVISALICGWLALKYGDRFWQEMCRLRWW